jgi:hypothetical protein
MVTAKKHGRNGTRYSNGRDSVVIYPFRSGYASRVSRSDGRIFRAFHPDRADAAYLAGEWMDPEQNGRFILDNDMARLRQQVAA